MPQTHHAGRRSQRYIAPVFSGGGFGGELGAEFVGHAALAPGGRFNNAAVAAFDTCPLNNMLGYKDAPGASFSQYNFGTSPQDAVEALRQQMPDSFGDPHSFDPQEREGDFLPEVAHLGAINEVGMSKAPAGLPLVMLSGDNMESMLVTARNTVHTCSDLSDPDIMHNAAYFTYLAGGPSGTGSGQMVMLCAAMRHDRVNIASPEEWHTFKLVSRSAYPNQDGEMWRRYGANQAALLRIINWLDLHGTEGVGRFSGKWPFLSHHIHPGKLFDQVYIHEKLDARGTPFTTELLVKMLGLEQKWQTLVPEPYRFIREKIVEARQSSRTHEMLGGAARCFASSGFRMVHVAPETRVVQHHLVQARLAEMIRAGNPEFSYVPLKFSVDEVSRLSAVWQSDLAHAAIRPQDVEKLTEQFARDPQSTFANESDRFVSRLQVRASEIIDGAPTAFGGSISGERLNRTVGDLSSKLTGAIQDALKQPGRINLLRELRRMRDALAVEPVADPITGNWDASIQEAVDAIQDIRNQAAAEREGTAQGNSNPKTLRGIGIRVVSAIFFGGTKREEEADGSLEDQPDIVEHAKVAAGKCLELFSAKRAYEIALRLNQVRTELLGLVNEAIRHLEQQVVRLAAFATEHEERAVEAHQHGQVDNLLEFALVPEMDAIRRVTRVPDGALDRAISAMEMDGRNLSEALDVVPEGEVDDVALILNSPEAMERIRTIINNTTVQARINTTVSAHQPVQQQAVGVVNQNSKVQEYRILSYPARYQRIIDALKITLNEKWVVFVGDDKSVSGIVVNVHMCMLTAAMFSDTEGCESHLKQLQAAGGDEYLARFLLGRYTKLPSLLVEDRMQATALAALALIIRPDAELDQLRVADSGWERVLLEHPAEDLPQHRQMIRTDGDTSVDERALLVGPDDVNGFTYRSRGVNFVGNRDPHPCAPVQQVEDSTKTGEDEKYQFSLVITTEGGTLHHVINLGAGSLNDLIDEVQINPDAQDEIRRWFDLCALQHRPGGLEALVLQFAHRLQHSLQQVKLLERSRPYGNLEGDNQQVREAILTGSEDAYVVYSGLYWLSQHGRWARRMHREVRQGGRSSRSRRSLRSAPRSLRLNA